MFFSYYNTHPDCEIASRTLVISCSETRIQRVPSLLYRDGYCIVYVSFVICRWYQAHTDVYTLATLKSVYKLISIRKRKLKVRLTTLNSKPKFWKCHMTFERNSYSNNFVRKENKGECATPEHRNMNARNEYQQCTYWRFIEFFRIPR